MGMTAAQWSEVTDGAVAELGSGWVCLGHGRNRIVMRVPVGWWVQFLYYENTSSGRLVVYQSFLGRPIPRTQVGDRGISDEKLRVPGYGPKERGRFTFAEREDPAALADFLRTAVTDRLYAPMELRSDLDRLEAWLQRVADLGHEMRGYSPWVRNRLVLLRIVLGTRPVDQLVEDVQWLLDDDDLDRCSVYTSTTQNDGPQQVQAFLEELHAAVSQADRAAVGALMTGARSSTLAQLGVDGDDILTATLPEPEVQW